MEGFQREITLYARNLDKQSGNCWNTFKRRKSVSFNNVFQKMTARQTNLFQPTSPIVLFVSNSGAGREDPDAVLLKSTKVYSNSKKVEKKQKARLSRIIKILKLWQEIKQKHDYDYG